MIPWNKIGKDYKTSFLICFEITVGDIFKLDVESFHIKVLIESIRKNKDQIWKWDLSVN